MSRCASAAFGNDVEHGAPGEAEPREQARVAREPSAEVGFHLAAVLRAEGRRVELQEEAVEAHQAVRGATPLAWASRTRPASRRASARATARP